MPSLIASLVTDSSTLQTSLVCIATFIFIIWWRTCASRSRVCLPPGPRGWPWVGYLPNVVYQMAWKKRETHEVIGDLAKTYGGACGLRLGAKNVVVLNGYEAIKEAFQHPDMNDRPQNVMIKDIDDVGTGILYSSGDTWREIRKFTVTKLKSFGFGKRSFAENISTEIEFMNTEIAKLEGKPFFPRSLLEAGTLNVVSTIILGQRFEYDDEQLVMILNNLRRNGSLIGAGGAILFLPFLTKFLRKAIMEYQTNLNTILNYIRGIVGQHQANFTPNYEHDYIDAHLNEMHRNKKELNRQSSHDMPNLIMTVGNLYAAGAFTTADTISWTILYMTKNQDMQRKVQQEIDHVIGPYRSPQMDDKPKLPYTWAVVLETMRLATVAPLGITHSVGKDTALFGCVIPKDTILIPNLWHIHHDPAVWTDPNQFKPDRFLSEDGTKTEEPSSFVPFGIGRRSCPGEQLARMELFLLITHLFQKFSFQEDPNQPLTMKGIFGFGYSAVPYNVCAHLRNMHDE